MATLLPTPANFQMAFVVTTAVASWDIVEGAISYIFQYGLVGSTVSDVILRASAIPSGSAAFLPIPDLSFASAYRFAVRTYPASARTPWLVLTSPDVPAPANLRVGTPTSTTIPLAWHSPILMPVNKPFTYALEYRTGSNVYSSPISLPQTASSHTLTGLSASTQYDVRIRISVAGEADSKDVSITASTSA